MPIRESRLNPEHARFDQVIAAGEPFMQTIRRGQFFRILDLEGNQAVDTLFFSADDPSERYSAQDTIRRAPC
jgi:uncharacterized protein YcgI (DUF1989 family)